MATKLKKRKLKAPFSWYGGKWALAPVIANLLPPHRVYVEVFGGAASVLFAKEKSFTEIYNDIDKKLVRFFRVLREHPKKLCKKLKWTPHSREEFYVAVDTMLGRRDNGIDDVEFAARFFIAAVQGFGSAVDHRTGWAIATHETNNAATWISSVDSLYEKAKRIRTVSIENRDFRRIFEIYDSEQTVFYVDPPYVMDTRTEKKGYSFEMRDRDHRILVDLLLRMTGEAIVSGYDHPIYDRLSRAKGWVKLKYHHISKASAKKRKGAVRQARRIEILWLSPGVGRFYRKQVARGVEFPLEEAD